jgi:cell growth-regulating nucleolar protein
LTPHDAYAQDTSDAHAVALVDAPPRAPTPPPAAHSLGYSERAALPPVNVFDFLDQSETPSKHAPANESRMIQDADVMAYQVTDDEPVRLSKEKPDAFTTPAPKKSKSKSRDETTSKKSDRKRKRNSPAELDLSLAHAQGERDVSMSDAPPVLHSGLTGGLNKLLSRPEFPPSPDDSGDFANSPLSPMKRAKQGSSKALLRAQKEWDAQQKKERKASSKDKEKEKHKEEKTRDKGEKKEKERGRERDRKERKASTALVKVRPKKRREGSGSGSSKVVRRELRHNSSSVSPAPHDRKAVKAIEYNQSTSESPAPENNGQLIVRPKGEITTYSTDTRAGMFMSVIDKGPDSERGVSINKALKRYHRERNDKSKTDSEKELWKDLRLKRNDRGEIVLFLAPESL